MLDEFDPKECCLSRVEEQVLLVVVVVGVDALVELVNEGKLVVRGEV